MARAVEQAEKLLHAVAADHEAHHDAHQHVSFFFPLAQNWFHRPSHWLDWLQRCRSRGRTLPFAGFARIMRAAFLVPQVLGVKSAI